MADDVRHLNVFIAAQIDDGEVHEERMSVPIPPDYDAADIRALTVRKIEDTAFALARNDFGRQPTLTALRAAVARLIGIAITLRLEGTREDLVERVQNVIDLSNDDAIELYGEPEGE